MNESLNSKLNFIPLNPKHVMRRNELCWCGSDKKWKKCHKDRHLHQKVPTGKLAKESGKAMRHGICMHPEAGKSTCSKGTIKAHTIQKEGGLRAIADEGHVISAKTSFELLNKNHGELVPASIGIKNASTFMGFCSHHDNSMFEPIENKSAELTCETAFLLAFRALSYECLMKKNAIKSIEIFRDLDKGKGFPEQVEVQNRIHQHLAGTQSGLLDAERWKSEYDKIFLNRSFDSMPHYALEFDNKLPFVCSGCIHPEIDFDGQKLQSISSFDVDFEHVCINVSATGNKTFLAFGWHGAKDGPAEQFVKSFKSIENCKKANAALVLAVEQLENTYFNPTWWNSLSAKNKKHLTNRMESGLEYQSIRPEATFTSLLQLIPDIEITNEIGSI